MTDEQRQAYISRIVNAAPPLTAEDAHRVRALVPLHSRLAAEAAAPLRRPPSRRKTAA